MALRHRLWTPGGGLAIRREVLVARMLARNSLPLGISRLHCMYRICIGYNGAYRRRKLAGQDAGCLTSISTSGVPGYSMLSPLHRSPTPPPLLRRTRSYYPLTFIHADIILNQTPLDIFYRGRCLDARLQGRAGTNERKRLYGRQPEDG